MADGQPIAGYEGSITVGSSTLCLEEWSSEGTAGDIKTTNFCSGGFAERIGGIVERKITAKGFWDAANNPHEDPPGIFEGDIIGPVTLVLTETGGLSENYPEVLVTRCTSKQTVEGRADFDFEGMSTGKYTLAGGINPVTARDDA